MSGLVCRAPRSRPEQPEAWVRAEVGSAQRRRLGVWGTKAAQSTLKLLNYAPDSSYPQLNLCK